MSVIEIIARAPTVEQYNRLIEAVGWTVREPAAVQAAMDRSLFAVCAVADGEVVGMGRAIGDLGVSNYIQDVIVDPQFQRQGIGGRIMSAIMDWLSEDAPAGSVVATEKSLLSTSGLTCGAVPRLWSDAQTPDSACSTCRIGYDHCESPAMVAGRNAIQEIPVHNPSISNDFQAIYAVIC